MRCLLGAALAGMLGLVGLAPASAQTVAQSGSAAAFGAEIQLAGEDVIREAEVEVEAPPFGDAAEGDESLIEIPADPLALSFTAHAQAAVHEQADLESLLETEGTEQEVAGPYHARGVGTVEDLEVLVDAVDDDVPLVEADLVRGEAVGVCVGDTAQYSATSEVVNLVIGGSDIPLNGPVQDLLGAIGEILVETGLSELVNVQANVVTELPDGGISVDALVITVLEAAGDDPLVSVRLGSGTVGALTCGDGVDPDDPLRELNKTASAAEVAPGGEFDYTIFVPNRGECTLTDVVVVDTITGPAGFEVISTDPAGTIDGGTVTFDVGSIEPNETVVLTIRVSVPDDAPDGATFDDVVTASGDCDGDPVEQTKELRDIPTVRTDFDGPCSVEFSNKESTHDEVEPGQTFAYLVNAFNSGAEPCTGITVTDTLDDRVEFVSCTGGCEVSGQVVTWTVPNLPGGSSTTLAVVVQVLPDATGTLANTAVIDPENGTSVTVDFTGPAVTDTSVPRDPVPPARGLPRGPEAPPAAPPGEPATQPTALPRTGAGVPLAAAGLLGLGGLALAGLRRRSLGG